MAESVIISLQRWSGGEVPILGIIVVDESSNLFNGFLFQLQYKWSDDVICRFVVDGKHLVFSSGYIDGSVWRLSKYPPPVLLHQSSKPQCIVNHLSVELHPLHSPHYHK